MLALLATCAGFVVQGPASPGVHTSPSASSTRRCFSPLLAEPEGAEPEGADAADADDDLLSSAAFLKQKLKVLEKEMVDVTAMTEEALAQADSERSEFAQQRTRLQTDFDNFKARHYNMTLDAQVEARVKMLSAFLEVLDNFDRARASISPVGEDGEAINGEYQALHAQLMGALDSLDVKKMEVLGTEFDYNMHMAIQQVPSDEYDEGLVCSELQPGYMCSDKLLRAAYVMVSAGS